MSTNEPLIKRKMPPLTDGDMKKRVIAETERLKMKDGVVTLKPEKKVKEDKTMVR